MFSPLQEDRNHELYKLFDLWGLKRNEKKTPEEIAALQKQKLRRLLHYAYETSEYYRNSFEKAGITADKIDSTPLSHFPVIDKSVLLSQFDSLVTVSDLNQEEIRRFGEQEKTDRKPLNGKYHIVHSSGSTGKPGYFATFTYTKTLGRDYSALSQRCRLSLC